MKRIEDVWPKILEYEGETFYTVKGRPCSYKVVGSQIVLLNTNRNIPKSNIERALEVANPTVSQFERMNLQGPSYIMAIIKDERILGNGVHK